MADPGGRRAALFWARLDMRRRWRSLLLLGLLIGVTAGFAMSALVGARQTDSAVARLRAQTHASDAVVFPSQVGLFRSDWTTLARRPEVAHVGVWDLLFGSVDNQPGALLFGSDGGTYLGRVDKPVVVSGRALNPAAADEVVVDENFTKEAPLGSSFTFQPYGPTQTDTTGQPTGPKVTMHVVGVVRELQEFLFVANGQVLVSPGFLAKYGNQVLRLQNADVTLRHGAADIGALRRDAGALLGGAPVLDLHAVSRRIDTTLDVERTALLLLAAAVALAGGILVSQALGRSASTIGDDARTLRSFGLTRGDLGLATGLSHVIVAVTAGLSAFAAAVGLSSRFPVGLGRRIDPSVGTHLDWTVLGPGVAVTIVGVLAATLLLGRRAEPHDAGFGVYRSSTLLAAFRRRAPLAVGLGASMAFQSGAGRSRVPVMPALLGAVVAVIGVTATLSIDHDISNVLAHPELAGVTWDAGVTPNTGAQTGRNVTPELASKIVAGSGHGAAEAVIDRDVLGVGGQGAPTFAIRPMGSERSTPISFTLVAGRRPARLGEAAIGPATANSLHVHIGDTVSVGRTRAQVHVVGEALFPSDVHAEFDEGLWLSPAQFDAIVPPIGPSGSQTDGRLVAVRFGAGTNVPTAIGRLSSRLGPLAQDVSPPAAPDELLNLGNVRVLPDVLAAFLGLIGVAALSFVLFGSAQRRRRDFAILRAMGMRRRNTRLVLNVQGTAIGLFGVVVGIPVGLAVGRTGWRLIAEHVPLAYIAPLAVLGIVLIIPATILLANLLAMWPGQLVARTHLPARELRVE
ncbi:MAG TPA: FtsX-like permease family protein [Acidimicrobiales bacterium]|nr:FtsX-like permease family protein [Acidimicrobiales bacterium]